MTTRNPQGLKISPQPKTTYTESELAEAFPDIDPGHRPFGSRVIVQLRSAKNISKGGIIIPIEAQEVEKWNTQIGKIRAIGPGAFRDRKTLKVWPEGEWCKQDTFVRIPKYNQDKWEIQHGEYSVLFVLINDLDLLAKVECNPLEIKAYI